MLENNIRLSSKVFWSQLFRPLQFLYGVFEIDGEAPSTSYILQPLNPQDLICVSPWILHVSCKLVMGTWLEVKKNLSSWVLCLYSLLTGKCLGRKNALSINSVQSKRDFVERVLSQISSVITYYRRNLTDNIYNDYSCHLWSLQQWKAEERNINLYHGDKTVGRRGEGVWQ